MEIMKLFMTKDEDLYDKTIEDVFDDEVFDSTFWLYWRTMFAFENWHSALEMKLYFQRFIHHIAGLPDFSALKFTKYNQYESLILPMKKYLEDAGVDFQFNTEVTNVIFNFKDGKKIATAIECKVKDVEQVSFLQKMIMFSSLTEAVQRARSTVTRTTRQTAMRRSVPVAFGPCGKISRLRILPSDIRKSSAQTFPEQTGNQLLSPLWMTVLSLISPISASVTHVPARLLPVVS